MKSIETMVTKTAKYFIALLFSMMFVPLMARADVSYLMLEALGASGEASSAGHSAIYFSNICADGPVTLRLCKPGEMGVVIALYPEFGADKEYEWIAVPILPFLYGVEDERKVPLYVNGEIRTLMRGEYRRAHLLSILPDRADGVMPAGRWQQMIGNSYNRDIYSFTLKTSVKEDAALIEKLNSTPNKNRFNTLYHNCADFSRELLNTYFPYAARRDVLNDFTMTSPKAVARSLTRYATKRPDRLFYITKYAQLAGPIRRSLDNRNYSQFAITSKKYIIPQVLFRRYLLAIFAVSYFTFGHFNTQSEYIKYPNAEIASLNLEMSRLKDGKQIAEVGGSNFSGPSLNFNGENDADPRARLNEIATKKEAERLNIFGTQTTWKTYQANFAPILQKAISDGLFVDEKEVKTFFRDLELQSEPAFDEQGSLILRVNAYGEDHMLGLTRENILSSQSNPQLAYKLMLAKVNATLKTKLKNREPLETFKADWDLMIQLSTRSAETFHPTSTPPKRFLVNPEKTTFGQKIKKIFVLITH